MAPEADIGIQDILLTFSGSGNDVIRELDNRAKGAYDALETSGHLIVNSSFAYDPYRRISVGVQIDQNVLDGYVTTQLAQPGFLKMMRPQPIVIPMMKKCFSSYQLATVARNALLALTNVEFLPEH